MKRLSMSQIALLALLIFLLILTGIWAVTAWNSVGDIEMSKHGWIALGLGTFFSLLIGCGLMALMFYSNRSGTTTQPTRLGSGESRQQRNGRLVDPRALLILVPCMR
jgi:TRAP-type C4-dicarboxylate transport system permease small subunit